MNSDLYWDNGNGVIHGGLNHNGNIMGNELPDLYEQNNL